MKFKCYLWLYILVNKMTETQTLISWSHCTYFEIWEIDQKPVFFLCKNQGCGMCTWTVWNDNFALSKSVADLTEEQKKELMLEEGLPAHMECSGYRKYVDEIIDIWERQSQRLCPKCGFFGRKDKNWTHITCNKWKHQFCYFWGLSFEVVDKRDPKGEMIEHNQMRINWLKVSFI